MCNSINNRLAVLWID